MEIRVEGRRLVGRLRETWLESVKANMAELERSTEKTSVTGINGDGML